MLWKGDALTTCITYLNSIKVRVALTPSSPTPKWRGLSLEMRGGNEKKIVHLPDEYWDFRTITTLMSMHRPVIKSNTPFFVGLRGISPLSIREIHDHIAKVCVWSIDIHLRAAGIKGATRRLIGSSALRQLLSGSGHDAPMVHNGSGEELKEESSSGLPIAPPPSSIRDTDSTHDDLVDVEALRMSTQDDTPKKVGSDTQISITPLATNIGGLNISEGMVTLDVVMSSEEGCSEEERFSEVNSVITESFMVNRHRSKQVPGIKKIGSGRSRRQGMSLYVKRNTVRNITSRVEANILRKLQTVDEDSMETEDDIDRLVTNTPERRSISVESRFKKSRRTGEPSEAPLTGEPFGVHALSQPGGTGTPDRKSKDSSVDLKPSKNIRTDEDGGKIWVRGDCQTTAKSGTQS